MSASSLSLPIFLRINFLISYLIVTDSQNTFDWHTQRALLNDKKAGAGCTSRAFKHPGRDVTAPDVWPSILTDYTYDSELDNADGVPLAFRRSSMFPEGNWMDQESQKKFVFFATFNVSYKFKRQRPDCCKSHKSHSKDDKLLICALPYNWWWMYIWMFF